MSELPEGAARVLDHGFVRLVETMGDDTSVVQAARVSYGQGAKSPKQDRGLINYLLKHDHGTPFEMVAFKFHVRAPIFVARQWFRHRWGSFNEISGRYVKLQYEFWLPDRLRGQDDVNKQGSVEDGVDPGAEDTLLARMREVTEVAFAAYEDLLAAGVAREMARSVLPLSLYTEYYWKVNARSLMNFLRLRAEVHAQMEIRAYAVPILRIFEECLPWTAAAFREHVLGGVQLDEGA